MKKNVIFRIAAIVLMCTLVTACFASSTFARYTSSSANNANTATVAKWSIKYNGTELAATTAPTVSFNVFSTVKDSNGTDSETDVTSGKIAPGTSGSFKIADIKNESEVTANISVKVVSVSNTSNIPIKFYSDEDMTKEITIAANTALLQSTDGKTAAGATLTGKTIYWKWAYGEAGADNALGIAAQTTAPTYVITLAISADQVD